MDGEEAEAPYSFELTSALAGVWTLLSLILFVAAAVGVGLLYGLARRSPFASVASLLLWPAAFLAVLPIHELVHAAVVRCFGGRPRFGAGIKSGMPYLYVSDPGRRFSRDQFLTIALAPLVLIDLLALAVILLNPGWSWAAPALVANTSGAAGDLWVTALLLRFPAWTRVEDRTQGFAVWPGPGHSPQEVSARAPRRRVVPPAWFAAWLVLTLAIFAVLPSPVLLLLGKSDPGAATSTLWLGPFALARVYRHAGGRLGARTVGVELDLLLIFVIAAFLAGVLIFLWWRRPRR